MARFIQVTLLGQTQQQQMIMTLYYRTPDTPADLNMARGVCSALGLFDPQGGTFARTLMDYMSTASSFDSVIARDIVNPLDFVARPIDVDGAIASTDLPSPFVAAKLTSARSRADIRATTHALPVPDDSSVQSGGLLAASYRAGVLAVGARLASPLSVSVNPGPQVTFYPVTIRKDSYTTASGKRAYRIPRDIDYLEENYADIESFDVAEYATTQNSRKRGRGA